MEARRAKVVSKIGLDELSGGGMAQIYQVWKVHLVETKNWVKLPFYRQIPREQETGPAHVTKVLQKWLNDWISWRRSLVGICSEQERDCGTCMRISGLCHPSISDINVGFCGIVMAACSVVIRLIENDD